MKQKKWVIVGAAAAAVLILVVSLIWYKMPISLVTTTEEDPLEIVLVTKGISSQDVTDRVDVAALTQEIEGATGVRDFLPQKSGITLTADTIQITARDASGFVNLVLTEDACFLYRDGAGKQTEINQPQEFYEAVKALVS